MKAMLKVECIGDDLAAKIELNRRIVSEILTPGIAEVLFGRFPARYFVAEIIGIDTKYGFGRMFLKGKKDYSESNSGGSRYVYNYYILESGKIYDVLAPLSQRRSDRYFCTVTTDGDIKRLTKEHVVQWLKNR